MTRPERPYPSAGMSTPRPTTPRPHGPSFLPTVLCVSATLKRGVPKGKSGSVKHCPPTMPAAYTTVYSKEIGSAAAPTAGLHFTKELLSGLEKKGVSLGYVTLHVGLGTFRPVKADDITDHKMHSEHYHLPAETAELINRTKKNGGRVIAVGTTSCRTLESCGRMGGELKECDGWADIFIYPGYEFSVIDGLITNFHLPESTLIMLVSAFAGYENTMNAYKTAVEERYRFFSFGDAMVIV